jgi:hypothetical protein
LSRTGFSLSSVANENQNRQAEEPVWQQSRRTASG